MLLLFVQFSYYKKIIVDIFFITNCTKVYNYTLKLSWFNSSHFDEEQKQNFKKSMYVTISKRFKTVDKQEKSNSSLQLFLEVWNKNEYIKYENKIITFLKLNKTNSLA